MRSLAFRRRRDMPATLTAPADLRGLIRAALADWAVIVLCWGAMALTPSVLLPVWVLVVAGRLHALGVVLHDACHMPRRPPTAASRWLELLAGYPVTTTLAAMRYHHLRHHRHNGTALDPYFKPGASHRLLPATLARLRGVLLPPAWIVRCYVGCLALGLPGLRNAYGRIFLGERGAADLRTHPELVRCLQAEPAQALFFLGVAAVALSQPAAVAIGYLLPLVLAGLFNGNRVVAEHIHVTLASSDAAQIVATTRTAPASWAARVLLYPRNIGFHTVHHLHPAVAMRCLPALHAWYREHEPGYRTEPAAPPRTRG